MFRCVERTLKRKPPVQSNKGVCRVRKNNEIVQNDTLASKIAHQRAKWHAVSGVCPLDNLWLTLLLSVRPVVEKCLSKLLANGLTCVFILRWFHGLYNNNGWLRNTPLFIVTYWYKVKFCLIEFQRFLKRAYSHTRKRPCNQYFH